MRLLKKFSDKDLIHSLKKGNIKAFDELYFRYVPLLLKFSQNYILDKVESEEAVQEIFIKIWERRMFLDGEQNFKSYIFQSVKHCLLNRIRDKKRMYKMEEMDCKYEREEAQALDKIYYKELEETTNEWIERLPVVQKQVFTLSRKDGLSHKEIAAKLNLSIRTVEHHIYLASKFMKGNMLKFKNALLTISLQIFLWV